MDFLNNIWADRVQLISLPLEVTGLALTYIEVLKPNVADKIEESIDLYQDIFKFAIYHLPFTKFSPKQLRTKRDKKLYRLSQNFSPSLLFLLFGFAGSIFLTAKGCFYFNKVTNVGEIVEQEPSLLYLFYLLFKIGILILLICVFILLFIFLGGFLTNLLCFLYLSGLSLLTKFLNRITNGRAIGAIGLILAALGVIGNLYQTATIFWGSQ